MIEKYSVLTKKYIFPIIIIIVGIILVKSGLSTDKASGITQTSAYLYGGIAILSMGIISALYILDIISKMIQNVLLIILLIVSVYLAKLAYTSVNETIAQIEEKKHKDKYIKQALRDIETIQLEYKKKFGWYCNDFNILKEFILNDSVYSVSTIGKVPDTKITEEHQKILGYNTIRDYKEIESYEEDEALLCGLLTKDTTWESVLARLFTSESALKNERIYPFNVENFNLVPLNNDKIEFYLSTDILESEDDDFEFLCLKENTFVSGDLIDKNVQQEIFYSKDYNGVVVTDTFSLMNMLNKNDIITHINAIETNNTQAVLSIIKSTKLADSLIISLIRDEKKIALKFFPRYIKKEFKKLYEIVKQNISPVLRDLNDFDLIPIETSLTNKESEFSMSYLDSSNLKTFYTDNKFTSSTYEYSDGIIHKGSIAFESNSNFYTLRKTGNPVFIAYDPVPYDPLKERDTLKTGSLIEVKTSGNWK